jgi:hypothetical protein
VRDVARIKTVQPRAGVPTFSRPPSAAFRGGKASHRQFSRFSQPKSINLAFDRRYSSIWRAERPAAHGPLDLKHPRASLSRSPAAR